MNKLALLAASTLFLLGTGFVACAPGAPDEPNEEESLESEAGAGQFCGGIAGIQCPSGKVCVDDRSDDCDPKNGGADCSGVCRGGGRPTKSACRNPDRNYVSTSPDQCAAMLFLCVEGTTPFFDACGCGCETSPATPCGPSQCGAGEFCCNESCGICAPEGGFCTEQYCGTI